MPNNLILLEAPLAAPAPNKKAYFINPGSLLTYHGYSIIGVALRACMAEKTFRLFWSKPMW